MKQLHKAIDGMSLEELMELKRQLETGNLSAIIKNKLERFKKDNSVCPICNSSVDNEGLTLVFGPSDLKQQAKFDGLDCLEYFIRTYRK